MSVKDHQLLFSCNKIEWNKNHEKIDKDLIKRFTNTYEFYDKDINKLILLLWKGISPYEYMDS